MTRATPASAVLKAFFVRPEPMRLMGGEGNAWLAGDLVLKPDLDPAEWSWLGEQLSTIRDDGFRLARPVRAGDGSWIVDGWGAVGALAGDHEQRWLEIVEVGERLHRAMRHLPRPEFLGARINRYAIADRVAWEETASPFGSALLDELVWFRRPIDASPQLVHGDLTENVLFADGLPPAVIDVSPYFRPPGYAAGIVIGDAVRWHGADPAPLVEAASVHHPELPQLLLRASIFRLVVGLQFDARREHEFEPDLELVRDLCG